MAGELEMVEQTRALRRHSRIASLVYDDAVTSDVSRVANLKVGDRVARSAMGENDLATNVVDGARWMQYGYCASLRCSRR